MTSDFNPSPVIAAAVAASGCNGLLGGITARGAPLGVNTSVDINGSGSEEGRQTHASNAQETHIKDIPAASGATTS